MKRAKNPSEVAGIILAAGEGKRLEPFVRRLRGDDLPKQYVNFIGRRSMLEHTFHRAEKIVPGDRLLTVVAKHHLLIPEVRRQLAARPAQTIVVQPANKETGPGLLLPFVRLYARHPESTVVVFPSDHFILDEDLLLADVELAIEAVWREPSRLVLLGMQPRGADTEYGYIAAAGDASLPYGLRRVAGFVEKPELAVARKLAERGGLWNTMIMVFRARTFWELVQRVSPELHAVFDRVRRSVDTAEETPEIERVYGRLKAVNFSKGILEAMAREHPRSLAALPCREVGWSDWGSERRLLNVLIETGYLVRLNRMRPNSSAGREPGYLREPPPQP